MPAKVIETQYRGYRFRSRLEARWAVYLDSLDLKWEYELEGYDLGDGIWYLPDFWLSQVNMWAEVKPGPLTPAEVEKCWRLAEGTGTRVLALVGVPQLASYCGFGCCVDCDGSDCDRCGGSGRHVTDFLVTDYHDYPATEHRFYQNTGEAIPADYGPIPQAAWLLADDPAVAAAIVAARSARFEHGEHGGVRPRSGRGRFRAPRATSGDAGPVTPWPQEPMSDDDHRRAAGCCPL